MRLAPGDPLLTFLNSASQKIEFDLFTFELKNGVTLRYCTSSSPLTYGGFTWLPAPAGLSRSKIRWATGIEVDTLDIEFQADASIIVGTVSMLAAAVLGAFDNARVTLSRLYMSDLLTVVGKLDLFQGNTAPAQVIRTSLRMTVKSSLEGLSAMIPPSVFQPTCMHVLFDAGCTVNSATYRVSSSVGSINTDGSIQTALGQASGYFQTGSIKFTGGANAGLTRTVKTFSSGAIYPSYPFPYVVAPGDTFLITPGCDHKYNGDCVNKYNNVIHFMGTPFVPVPETAA